MKTVLLLVLLVLCIPAAFIGGELHGRGDMKKTVAQMQSRCEDAEAALAREWGTPENAHDARCRAAAIALGRYADRIVAFRRLIDNTFYLSWALDSNGPESVAELAMRRLRMIEDDIRSLAMPEDKDVAKTWQMTLKACAAVYQKALSLIDYRKRYPEGSPFFDKVGFNPRLFYGFDGPSQDATMWTESLRRKKLPELSDATTWVYMAKITPEYFTK